MCGAGARAKEPGLEPVQRERNDRVIVSTHWDAECNIWMALDNFQ